MKCLATEPTIFLVDEGQVTVALVVNTKGSPIKIKHGLKLEDCLLYDRKVDTNPLELPTAWVAQTRKSTFDTDIYGQGLSINSAVKVVHYSELKFSLTRLQHVGFSQGTSRCYRAVHHINLNPDTKPLYIPVYRLPHSQRTIVDNMINDMLEQDMIQGSDWSLISIMSMQ